MPAFEKLHPTAEADIALVVGRAPWWVPASALKRRKRQKSSFTAAMKDFLLHTSFHCYGKLVEPGRRLQEKLFWLVFHIVAFTILISFLWATHNSESSQLLSTTIYNPLYPIQKVPFPAISICSINRISNDSATRYAEELNAKDPRKRGVDYFYRMVHMLSYNYYVQDDNIDYESALEFQRFLDLFDTEDTELFYNTRRRMKMLTPSCEYILLHCRLAGKEINCTREFKQTLTSNGFCCTFNSDSKYSSDRGIEMQLFGPEKGLVLLLNASTKDYLYRSSSLDGFVASIYEPQNYPDIASSAVKERFLQSGSRSFVAIRPEIMQTVNEARFLGPKARNCLFEDEMPRVFGKSYSFNKCITRCRIRSILVLCQCLLFMSPYEYLDVATDTVYCTLQHKECLKRYDFKWLNVITHRESVLGLEREMEDALYCPDCLPSCSEIRYKVSVLGLPLNEYNMLTMPKDIECNHTELALVSIFFAVPHVEYFQQILQNSWFEVFSTIGNICGIITGFSLIGICEIFFFFMRQLLTAYKDEASAEMKQKLENSKEELIILP